MHLKREKRCRPYLQQKNDSWRVDETYIKVKGKWKYLYRAVDSLGNTIDFMLSAKRDKQAAKCFFQKALKATRNSSPRVINVDKNATYPPAVDELKTEAILAQGCELRQNKYLNNIVEK
jgi:transposase-like protein